MIDMLLTLGILAFIIEIYSALFSLFNVFPICSVLNVELHLSLVVLETMEMDVVLHDKASHSYL
jgi:hypothetical protein